MIISKNNLRFKQVTFATETRCMAIVAEGVARYVLKPIVMRRLRGITTDPFLLSQFKKMFDELRRKAGVKHGSDRRETVASEAYQMFDKVEQLKNAMWREKDQHEKIDDLAARLDDEDNIFFVCSRHQDCAKDHEPYQGRLYVSENWKNKPHSKEVARYINNRKATLRTVESVCYDYPYLITRPNCRHTMKPVKTSAVLSGDWKDEIDYVKSQKKNLTYIKYYERLKYLEALNERLPNKQLQKEMARTRTLMRKHKIKRAGT